MSANDSLQTLRQRLAAGVPTAAGDDASARRQWWAALTVVQELLLEQGCQQGLWLAAPLPALHEPLLISRFHGWVWTPPQWSSRAPELPGSATNNPASERSLWQLPLQASDGTDPLLLLITGPMQVAMALHGSGNPAANDGGGIAARNTTGGGPGRGSNVAGAGQRKLSQPLLPTFY